MPHHCQKSRSRSGVGKRNSRSLGTRRRRGASISSARRRRSRKTSQMGSRRRVYRRTFGTKFVSDINVRIDPSFQLQFKLDVEEANENLTKATGFIDQVNNDLKGDKKLNEQIRNLVLESITKSAHAIELIVENNLSYGDVEAAEAIKLAKEAKKLANDQAPKPTKDVKSHPESDDQKIADKAQKAAELVGKSVTLILKKEYHPDRGATDEPFGEFISDLQKESSSRGRDFPEINQLLLEITEGTKTPKRSDLVKSFKECVTKALATLQTIVNTSSQQKIKQAEKAAMEQSNQALQNANMLQESAKTIQDKDLAFKAIRIALMLRQAAQFEPPAGFPKDMAGKYIASENPNIYLNDENIIVKISKLLEKLKKSLTDKFKDKKTDKKTDTQVERYIERFIRSADQAIDFISEGDIENTLVKTGQLENFAELALSSAEAIPATNVSRTPNIEIANEAVEIAKLVRVLVGGGQGRSTQSWFDYITGYLWPTNTFSKMQEYVSSAMPSVSLPDLPESLTPAQNKLSRAIQDFIDDNPTVTKYIPWVLFGVVIVCLGLRAAWPKLRASYIAAEKITKRYTADFVKSFNYDDEDDEDEIPQRRRSYSNRNRKTSRRYGKSKAYSSTR